MFPRKFPLLSAALCVGYVNDVNNNTDFYTFM
jgi:hypothetical protein